MFIILYKKPTITRGGDDSINNLTPTDRPTCIYNIYCRTIFYRANYQLVFRTCFTSPFVQYSLYNMLSVTWIIRVLFDTDGQYEVIDFILKRYYRENLRHSHRLYKKIAESIFLCI